MNFKFVSNALWSEKQNILQHMHKKRRILVFSNKCENGPSASFSCLRLFPHLLVKIQNSYVCVDEHLPLPVPLLQPPVPFCELSPALRLFSNDLAMLLY